MWIRDRYKETRKQVEETEARLEKEKEELDEMKASAEAELSLIHI